MLKYELLIPYYKRPKIVLNALESIAKIDYDNWHLTFIDDSGDDSFREAFFNYGLDKDKIKYTAIMMSDDEKIKIGGSIYGKYLNNAIQETNADVIIVICDDDAIFSNYLSNLNKFYADNPNKVWCYSNIKFFNPETEHYSLAQRQNNPLNAHVDPIAPSCVVDNSQVSFKKKALVEKNLWYPYPYTKDLDSVIFGKIFAHWGPCPFANCYSQYKGWFNNQLSQRKKDFI